MATLRRTEAKAFFANERTFLHWMNMSVTLGSISAAGSVSGPPVRLSSRTVNIGIRGRARRRSS